MKVVLPKNDGSSNKKRYEEAVLPLVDEDTYEEDKTKLAKFKLRTNPARADSSTYDFFMLKIDGSESVRKAIRFLADTEKVFTGLNITNVDIAMRMYRELLNGEAKSQFNGAVDSEVERLTLFARQQAYDRIITAGGTEVDAQAAYDAVAVLPPTMDILKEGIRGVIAYMAPTKALTRQKRWMRRFCRKPAGMSVRSFCNHLNRINNEELPMLPPFGNRRDQMLSPDEIVDILLNGIPRSWMKEMDKQGFDPVEKTLAQVIDFCERVENAEDFEPARKGGETKSKDGKKSSSSSAKKTSGGNGSKYCLLHGNNNSHATDECMVLKKQAKALRSNNESGDRKPPHKNKTWKRDADKSTNSSKKELAAFVRKQSRKELCAFAKKRKASDDSDDDESVSHMEEGEVNDLSKLNFGNMDNLKISSDDEDDASVKSSVSA